MAMTYPNGQETPFNLPTVQNALVFCARCGIAMISSMRISGVDPDRFCPGDAFFAGTDKDLRTHGRWIHCGPCMRGIANAAGPGNDQFHFARRVLWEWKDSKWHFTPIPQKKEEPMASNTSTVPASTTTLKEKGVEQLRRLGAASGLGMKLAVADQAGETLLDIAKELGNDIPQMQILLSHPDGRELAKIIVALGVHSLCTYTSMVPNSESIASAVELNLTASSMKLVAPRLHQLRLHLTKLASLGDQINDGLPEEGSASLSDLMPEKAPEAVPAE